MYKYRRLRALLRTLVAMPPTRLQVIRGWLVVVLGYAAAALFALSLIVHSSHDWPVTWHDVFTFDLVARAYLLGACAAFVSGCAFLLWIILLGRGASARMLPPPGLGLALRRAIRIHEPWVAPADPATPTAPQVDNSAATRLTVATSYLLTRPLWLAIVTLAGGALALLPVVFFASFAFSMAGPPADPAYAMPDAVTGSYQLLWIAGIFAPLVVIAAAFAWRYWIGWRAGVRGVEIEVSPEGLAIRDHTTLWRGRFIRWSEIVSLARFTYNDDYVRPHTVYMLDADSQTLLWESPPDMRYEKRRPPRSHCRATGERRSVARAGEKRDRAAAAQYHQRHQRCGEDRA